MDNRTRVCWYCGKNLQSTFVAVLRDGGNKIRVHTRCRELAILKLKTTTN